MNETKTTITLELYQETLELWQADADREGIELSELIAKAMLHYKLKQINAGATHEEIC